MKNGYVALLRGTNVGGNNKIAMPMLKETFKRAGCQNIVTYLNTGNIIFNHEDDKNLEAKLEKAITKDFGLQIKVLLKTFDQMSSIFAALPKDWANNDTNKSDVLFLWEEVDSSDITDQIKPKDSIDNLIYVPGALLQTVSRKNITKSALTKLPGTKLYKKMTIRNVNTTRKIWELMN